jgi:hypothetical protein
MISPWPEHGWFCVGSQADQPSECVLLEGRRGAVFLRQTSRFLRLKFPVNLLDAVERFPSF